MRTVLGRRPFAVAAGQQQQQRTAPLSVARRRRRSIAVVASTGGGGSRPQPPLPVLGGGGGAANSAANTNTNTPQYHPDDVAAPIPLGSGSSDTAAAAATAAIGETTTRLLLDSSTAPTTTTAITAENDLEGVLSELVHLPVDCTELLGLRGSPSYLLCDVTRAYDALLGRAPDLPGGEADELPGQGFSDAALAGRVEVLELAKDAAVMAEGRVGGRAAPRWLGVSGGGPADLPASLDPSSSPSSPPSFAVPVYLLPSALVLLCQVGRADVVADLAAQALSNWTVRAHHKRDLLLALALSFCGAARDLFDAGETLRGCAALEEALGLLRNATAGGPSASPVNNEASSSPLAAALAAFGGGDAAASSLATSQHQQQQQQQQPPLAPRLAAEIEQALHALEPPRVLEELRLLPPGDPSRRRSVAALRAMLTMTPTPTTATATASEPVTPDYARMAFAAMGSGEVCEAADWAALAGGVAAAVRGSRGGGGASAGSAARRYLASAAPWLFPGALATAAAAHLVAGFAAREPETIRLAAALAGAADVVAAAGTTTATTTTTAAAASTYPTPVPPPASAESAVLRSVAAVLLGAVDDAQALLEAAQALPSAAAGAGLPWPSAEAQLSAAGAAPADPLLTDSQTGGPMLLPASPQAAWRFVRSQAVVGVVPGVDGAQDGNGDQQEEDLLPGLCVFAELWLSRLGFAAFPDTLEQPPSPVLSHYFGSARVEALLERYAQEAAAVQQQQQRQRQRQWPAAGGVGGGIGGGLPSSAAMASAAAAAAAKYVGGAQARVAEGVRSVGRGLRGQREQQQPPQQQGDGGSAAAAATAPSNNPATPPTPVPVRSRIPASLPPPPPPLPSPPRPSASFLAAPASAAGAAVSRPASPAVEAAGTAAAGAPAAAATAAPVAAAPPPASARFLASQQKPKQSWPPLAPALAAARDLVAGAAALAVAAVSSSSSSSSSKLSSSGRKPITATTAAAAAVLGGAVLVTAAIAARLGGAAAGGRTAGAAPLTKPQQHRVAAVAAPTAFASSSARSRAAAPIVLQPVRVRVVGGPDAGRELELSPQAAERLLRRWLEAKSAALGPRYDAAALSPVAADPLLSAVAARADRYEAGGWYLKAQRPSAYPRVTRLAVAGGGVTATADVHESGALCGVGGGGGDGGASYSSAFEAEYKLVLCADGEWRVAGVKVLGDGPGGSGSGGGGAW